MHILIDRQLGFEMVEEVDKFPAAMTILTGPNDLAVEDIEGGKSVVVPCRLSSRRTLLNSLSLNSAHAALSNASANSQSPFNGPVGL